jgi:hypothetical protein
MAARYILSLVLALLACAGPGRAVDEIRIGRGGKSWLAAVDSSTYVGLAPDSVWMWQAEAGRNVALDALSRGGSIGVAELLSSNFGIEIWGYPSVQGVEAVIDGDATTAFNPLRFGLPADVEIHIDLGGTYNINSMQIFPRLNSEGRRLFPQAFGLGVSGGLPVAPTIIDQRERGFSDLIFFSTFNPNQTAVNYWPSLQEQVVRSFEARYVRFKPDNKQPWEVAEIEIIADGTAPVAHIRSFPQAALNSSPVWGRVKIGNGELADLPVVLQTRTGPDDEPVHYFFQTGPDRQDLVQTVREIWENLTNQFNEKGPALPNPAWSPWETVTDGVILSPPGRFIQFQMEILQPGVRLEQLVFEHTNRPLAQVLEAEVSPLEVEAGAETDFTLTLGVRKDIETGLGAESGFRHLRVRAPVEVVEVERVLIKDREALFDATIEPGEGFSIRLWERVLPENGFVQVFFKARVFIDGSRFRVWAVDFRPTSIGGEEEVQQAARAADVDLLSPGADLSVRLSSKPGQLVDRLRTPTAVFSPNGDGINDYFQLSYQLFKLTAPAPVFFEIFDLHGRRLQQGFSAGDVSGSFARVWDGTDLQGKVVAPGIYMYRVQVQADDGTVNRQGTINVAY